jgi:transcriptional regulator with XRE-family HTH domain
MTHDPGRPSLYDEASATPAGAREVAAARTALRVAQLLQLAKERSGITSRALAERLGIGESRVSQVLNGDGNLHVATISRFLHAMGYELELAATVMDGGGTLQLPKSERDAARFPRRP